MSSQTAEPLPLNASKPFLLDEPGGAWLVLDGRAHVFAVPAVGEQAAGPRRYVFSVQAGELLIGIAPEAGAVLLACGGPGTRLARVDRPEPALVEGWIEHLSASLSASGSGPRSYLPLGAGCQVDLATGQAARASEGLAWVDVPAEGAVAFLDIVPLPAGRFPLARSGWLRAADDMCLTAVSSAQAMAEDGGWDSVRRFATMALGLTAERARVASEAEEERMAQRDVNDGAALHRAYGSLAAALNGDARKQAAGAAAEDPLFAACLIIGEAAGIDFKAPPPVHSGQPSREPVEGIAHVSRVRHRQVALNGRWWRADHGPLLGYLGDNRRPVALLPAGRRGYDLADPSEGMVERVTPALAAKLQAYGCAFYRPLPDKALRARDLIRFGLRPLGADLWRMLLTGAAGGLLALLTPVLTGILFDDLIPNADHSGVLVLALALIVSALAMAAFGIGQELASTRIESRADLELQAAVWDRLLGLPASFFRRYSAGDLASRAMGISLIRQALTDTVTTSLFSAIFSVFSFALLFYYDAKLAVVAACLVATTIALTLLASRAQLRHLRPMITVQNRLQGLTFQLLTGVAKLRVAGAEARAFAVWANDVGRANGFQRRSQLVSMRVDVFYACLPLLSSMLIFSVAAFARGPALSTGAFLAFVAAFGQVTAAAVALAPALAQLLGIVPLYDSSRPIFESAPEVDVAKADPGELAGHIEVSHVDFRYGPDRPLVLDDVSFEAQAGQFVALVGPSGSGKSTIFRLLLGFETAAAGSVHYDGQDLSGLDARAVRRQFGVVLQSGKLMPGSIFENIVGSANLTLDDAWEAARLAGFEDDVKAMPMGMQTFLTDGSGTISGGQRQRLMIARAIAGKPRILLFDEATSALDNQTQAIVSRSLDQLKATRIVIAHRLSTVMKADVIYVLVGGRIVQRGTYAELLAQAGPFAEFAKRQLS